MIEMTKEDREMDDLFHGEEKPLHPDTIHMTFRKPVTEADKVKSMKAAHDAFKESCKNYDEAAEKASKTGFQPAKHAPNQMDKLKACAKSVLLFGGLSFLIFYWQQAGLMAESIAVPSIAVCTALAGFGAGKSAIGGGR